MKLKIGTGLTLPLDAVTETFAILGRRGSGKTHTAVVMAEEMLAAGVPVVVLDPLDVWWGLRVSKDGKAAGFPIYVAGGSHADIPLLPDAGKVIADAVVDKGLSIVLSVRHLSKTDQRRFVGEFCERLYDRKADPKHRTALHVFIDEADAFVPQRLLPGGERCYGAVDTMVRRGRSSGLAITLISQRPQVIAKDVLSQTEVLVAHQLTGPQDRKALDAWVEANDTDDRRGEFMASLASLPKGTAWFWSPGLLGIFKRVEVRDRHTFDSSATPKAGVSAVASPKAFAAVDLEKLTAEIAATIAKAKAENPAELRKEIATLRRELDAAKKATPAPKAETKTVERFVLKDGQLARAEGILKTITNEVERHETFIKGRFDLLRELTADIAAAIAQTRASNQSPHTTKGDGRRVVPSVTTARPAAVSATRVPPSSGNGHGAVSLPPGEHATLTAALQYPGIDRKRLGILTGYKRSSRDAYIVRLASKGLVEVAGNALHATEAGQAALNGSFQPLPTGAELIEYWRQRLPEGERATLNVLIDASGDEVAREVIDEGTGYKRSSRDAYLVRLKAKGLVEFCGRGTVRASAELFE